MLRMDREPGEAVTGSHVVKPPARRLGLAVGLGFGASEEAGWYHLASGWVIKVLGSGEPQPLLRVAVLQGWLLGP